MAEIPWTKARIKKAADDSLVQEVEKAESGTTTAAITGLASGTVVADGDYYVVGVGMISGVENESVKTNIPGFTVNAAPVPAFDPNGETKPTDAQTIDEIKAWLTAHSIDFSGKTLKADLLALVPAE